MRKEISGEFVATGRDRRPYRRHPPGEEREKDLHGAVGKGAAEAPAAREREGGAVAARSMQAVRYGAAETGEEGPTRKRKNKRASSVREEGPCNDIVRVS